MKYNVQVWTTDHGFIPPNGAVFTADEAARLFQLFVNQVYPDGFVVAIIPEGWELVRIKPQ